jgi:hypothetical protein
LPSSTFNGYKVTYTVKSVSVTEDSSVGRYRGQEDLHAVLTGLKKKDGWTFQFQVTPVRGRTPTSLRVNGYGYPLIDQHPGHVHDRWWKYNIDKGTHSVDRLVLSDVAAALSNQHVDEAKKTISLEAAVTCKAKVLEDTH